MRTFVFIVIMQPLIVSEIFIFFIILSFGHLYLSFIFVN